MKLATPLIASVLAVFLFVAGNAQTIAQPEKARLSYTLKHPKQISPDIADTLLRPSLLMSSADTIIVSLRFSSPDTVNVSKIHLKLGTTEGGNELLTTIYDFDNYNQSNGLKYSRKKNKIRLELGAFLYQTIFYCDIWLEDTSGNLSPVTKCQTK